MKTTPLILRPLEAAQAAPEVSNDQRKSKGWAFGDVINKPRSSGSVKESPANRPQRAEIEYAKSSYFQPIFALAAVLLLALAGCNKTPDNRILLSGNIELKLVDISFKTPGRLVELAVEEGSSVKAKQLIARIDKETATRTRDREAEQIGLAETQIRNVLTGIEWQKATLASELELRQAELAQAQANLDRVLAGARPQELQASRAALEDSRAQANVARLDWERAQTLIQNEDISRAQHDQNKARFESANANVKRLEENLGLLAEGARKEESAAARAQVERARAARKLTEATHYDIERKQTDVQARRIEMERAKKAVSVMDSQLDDAAAYSPIDGIVLVKSADPGEVLAAGTSVVTIGEMDHPWLRGYIPQDALGRVKIGQEVKVTSDSYPGKVYRGRVSFIASQAEFTPKQIQTKDERVKLVYRIKVDVENPGRELKNNMPVDAELTAP